MTGHLGRFCGSIGSQRGQIAASTSSPYNVPFGSLRSATRTFIEVTAGQSSPFTDALH